MNGIVSLSDGAGTTITGGQVITNDFSGNSITVNSFSAGTFDLNNSLTLEQYDNISTAVGLVSLWEKGKSYFTYLPQSLATPSNTSDLITLLFGNANYGRLTAANNWTGINTFLTQSANNNTTRAATTAFTQSAINRLLYFNSTSGNQLFHTTQFPAITTGVRNIGIGDCFQSLDTGNDNTCIGSLSLNALTSGSENFCLGGLSLRGCSSGSFNVAIGVQCLPNTNGIGNIGIGRYVGGGVYGDVNTYIGYFAAVNSQLGSNNTGIGAYCFNGLNNGSANTAIGTGAGNHDLGSSLDMDNNTFIGAGAQMSGGTTFSGSTAIGYNSRITASNNIFLGTATEPTNVMGGLVIPAGGLTATATQTITFGSNAPTMSGANIASGTIPVSAVAGGVVNTTTNQTVGGIKTFSSPPVMSGASITSSTIPVSAIAGGVVDITTNGQQISGRKDFNGFDNTVPNYCGTSLVSPVFRPRLYSLSDSINNSCHAIGSNTGRNLAVDPTNTGCFFMGQDNLPNKTLNSFNVCSIGGANMGGFTSESFSGVSVLGQANLQLESGYTMNNVCIFGGGTQFKPAAVAPTSVQKAAFFNSYGISLPSAAAITNVFGINTQQPITKSNQGIIGDSTEITLHSTGQKVVITGGLELDGFLSSSISPVLNWSSANFNLSTTTAFFQYYHFILNAATTITLPIITSAMVGQEFTLKRRGGTLSILSITTGTTGGALQPVFPIGGSLGVVAFPYALISASQSTAKLMCIQSHVAGTGTASCPASSTVLTVSAWSSSTSLLTIGTRITISTFTKTIVSYGTGTGRTGTYNIDTVFGTSAVSGTMTSADRFGYDILLVQ